MPIDLQAALDAAAEYRELRRDWDHQTSDLVEAADLMSSAIPELVAEIERLRKEQVPKQWLPSASDQESYGYRDDYGADE